MSIKNNNKKRYIVPQQSLEVKAEVSILKNVSSAERVFYNTDFCREEQ